MRNASRWALRRSTSGAHAGAGLAVAATALLVSSAALADAPPPPPGDPGQPGPPPAALPPAGYPQGYGAPPGYAPPPPGYAPPPAPYYGPATPYYGPPGYYGPGPGYYQRGYAVRAPYEYRSVPAMAAGIVGVSLGAILLIGALIVVAEEDSCVGVDAYGNASPCTSNPGLEAGLTIGGVIGIAVGIPLLIYGARKVPVGAVAAHGTLPSSPLPQWAGMPAGRGWKWEF